VVAPELNNSNEGNDHNKSDGRRSESHHGLNWARDSNSIHSPSLIKSLPRVTPRQAFISHTVTGKRPFDGHA
jgi:hypothetical protein